MRYRPGYTPTQPLPASLRPLMRPTSRPKSRLRPLPRLRADGLDRAVLHLVRAIALSLLLPFILLAAILTARGTVRTLGRWFHEKG
jgi:hypothetical protein